MGRLRVSLVLGVSVVVALGLSQASSVAAKGAGSGCGRLCKRSVDGMVYRILGEFRNTDSIGNPFDAFAFTVTNRSKRAEVCEPVPGFTATLNTGGVEQLTSYEYPSATDPSCASPTATESNSLTPVGYQVKPGDTLGPLEVCMALSPGQQLTKALLADNNQNLHHNAVIPLTGKIQLLPAPLPLIWPLPDPCKLPYKDLRGFALVDASTTPSDLQFVKSNWNTQSASAECVFYPQNPPSNTIYVGYVPPPEPSGKVSKIPGWPGATLVASTLPITDPSYFWEVTFKRSEER